MDITLQYSQSGTSYSQAFGASALVGVDEPDRLHKVGVVHAMLDGTLSEQIAGFRKEPITLKLQPSYTAVQRRFLVKWLLATTKRVIYGNYVSEGVTDEALVSNWLYDLEYGRAFDVQIYDEHVYHAWDDGVIVEDLMYLKRQVEVIGTLASPETFTTNTGKLVVMQNADAFPSFNSSTHDFLIVVNGDKQCEASFSIVKDSVSVVAGNLTWQMFISDFGQPAADSKYYASIAIFLQAK